MKVTLEQWRMFKAVVDYGGFNQAASKVFKSQSSVHSSVGKLEQSLGVQLLTIEGRRAVCTAIGEVMYRKASVLLEEAGRVEAIADSLSQGNESRLVIAVDEAFPQHELYQVLDVVSGQFPFLYVDLRETVLSGANELLHSGEVDIAVSPIRVDNCINEELCQVQFIGVASPEHRLLGQQHVSLEALKPYRQIVVRDSAATAKQDVGWLGSNQRWTVSHVRTSIDLLEKGLGFAWLPLPAVKESIRAGLLAPLPLEEGLKRSMQFYLNFLDADRLGPAARTFLAELRMRTLALESLEDVLSSIK